MAAPNKKLLLGICSALLLLLLAAALIYSFSLTLHLINYSPNLYTALQISALHDQWWLICRPWPIEAKLTPPLLVFLLLNLIVGALLLTNSDFLQTHTQDHRKIDRPFDLKDNTGRAGSKKKTTQKANVPSSIPVSSNTNLHHGSSAAVPAMLKQLTRSRSITMATSRATTSPAATVRSEELQQLAQITDYNLLKPSDPQSSRKKKLKKKRGESSSNYSQLQQQQQKQLDGAADHSLQTNSAPSAPPPQSSVNASSKDGDGGRGERDDQDEVDRRAEEFIGKFYLQMRMQRLASMERYNQRLDRSYGR